MNFQNLPADWPTIPLTDDSHIADVIDLFVGERDRKVGSLLILICDEQRRPFQPVIINDIYDGRLGHLHLPVARIAQELADLKPGATILCAIARRGPSRVMKTDRQIARSLERAFADRLELFGVHVITLDATVPIAARPRAA